MPETYAEIVNRVLREHEGYTGDGRGGVGELPIGDRSTARKVIEKRDLRQVLLAGETNVQAAIDAAAQATAAADDAKTAMLDVQGVTFFAASVQTLLANTGAHATGAIFVTRREGYSYEVVASDPDLTTAGGANLRALPTSGGTLRPEQFGAVGDGIADDTAAFRRMLSRSTRRFEPSPEKRYHITGQLDLGRQSEWVSPLLLRLTGSREAPGGSLNVQTSGGTAHLAAIFAEGHHVFRDLTIHQEIHPTSPWLAVVRNDFYARTNGNRASYSTRFEAERLTITASDYVTGYSGNGNGALSLQALDSVQIRNLEIDNYQNPAVLADIDRCLAGTETAKITNARGGLEMRCCQKGVIGNMEYRGHPSREMLPGANSIVVNGVEDFSCGDVTAVETGEHGIRVVSKSATAGAVGNYGRVMYSTARFGDIVVKQPGGCGFKCASADNGDEPGGLTAIPYVSIKSLLVEDAGYSLYASAPGSPGTNHFGLSLQNVRSFYCGRYDTRKVKGAFNGHHNIMFRDVGAFFIGKGTLRDSYSSALFLNLGSASQSNFDGEMNVNISNFASGLSAAAINLLNVEYAGRLRIHANIASGPSPLHFSGARGTPQGDVRITGTLFGLGSTDITGSPPPVRTWIEFAGPRWPVDDRDSVGEQSTGQILGCIGGNAGGAIRNGGVDVYLHPSSVGAYIAVPAGETAQIPTGSKLLGQWRSIGRAPDSSWVIVIKVAM